MVQAIVKLKERQDRVLTIVKGKYGLKNKSEAVNLIVEKYEEEFLEPNLKPEYEKELMRINKGKHKKFSSVAELRKELENA